LTVAAAAGDADLARLAKGGRQNIGGFVLRLAARIPFLFIAGRVYGPEALGRMAYAVLIVELAAQLATMGLKRGLALHMARDPRDDVDNAWEAVIITSLASLPLAGLLLSFPDLMFPNSAPDGIERLMPFVVPLFALTDVMLAGLAYRFDVGATVRARAIVEPWTISGAAFVLSYLNLRDGLLISYACAMAATFIAAAIPFVRAYAPRGARPRLATLPPLARRNLPLAAADAIEWGSRRLDLAILGLFVSPTTVGIYYVAQNLASLPQKLKTSFDPVLAPVITRNLADGDLVGIARAISQVGFWIVAAQAGIALSLGVPGEAIMGLVGKGGAFVGGNGALALLLLAEVVAATAVVSEHALVYIARLQNLAISIATIVLQAALSFLFLWAADDLDWPETWMAAGPALALVIALGCSALIKSRVASRLLGARVQLFRWPLLVASALCAAVGGLATLLPEWTELVVGIPAMLGIYAAVIWRWGFRADDRALFRARQAPA